MWQWWIATKSNNGPSNRRHKIWYGSCDGIKNISIILSVHMAQDMTCPFINVSYTRNKSLKPYTHIT
jgi:hypothetical protein